jgi:tripartite-type tricarboxylate transporter receptor subunit TctC
MKRVLFGIVALILAAVAGPAARAATPAESFPSRPIRYIVPFPPGGVTDMMARVIAQKVSEASKQAVVVDNRSGGNAMIGAVLAARSPADGYTWFGMTITHTINMTLFPDAPYNLLKDFTAVSVLGSLPMVMVVNPGVPAKSLAELTALGRTRELNGGSSGNGTPGHLGLELYRQLAKIKVQHIPYKGSGPALISVLGGEVDFLIPGLPECIMHIKSGKLRALVIASDTRHPLVADVPTTVEAGLPGFAITSWAGLMVPSGTPKDIVKRINAEVVRALKQPEVSQRVRERGFTLVAYAPEAAHAFMAAEAARWGKLVREANVKPDS